MRVPLKQSLALAEIELVGLHRNLCLVAGLRCGLAVGDSRFDLPQQSHDLLWLISLDGMTSFLLGGFSHSTCYKKRSHVNEGDFLIFIRAGTRHVYRFAGKVSGVFSS